MAVIRNTASALAKGRIGNTTYYVANGQQVARQSKNNSNYGETASRTESQQSRRVRWANLVNFYKACQYWMPKAFESKKTNQTDYNRFMQVNMASNTIALTKDMAANGCAVVMPFVVSQGSLQPIELSPRELNVGVATDISVAAAPASGATVGEVSAAIIAANPEYRNGDNIALVYFRNVKDSRDYPYVSTQYYEFTLDIASTASWASSAAAQHMEFVALSGVDYLCSKATDYAGSSILGTVFIHTRKDGGKLITSSQQVYATNDALIAEFSNPAAVQAAIDSYGVQEEVPLDPSFSGATILGVRINGGQLLPLHGQILTYNQPVQLTIVGANLDSESVYLKHGSEVYTPLVVEGDEWTYILGDNGHNRIYLNGSLYGGVDISGVVVPDIVPTTLRGFQKSDDLVTAITVTTINRIQVTNANCLNYPYKKDASYPYFLFEIFETELDLQELSYSNCSLNNSSEGASSTVINVSVTDDTKPAYIMYEGFIIAVFNYS